MATEQQTSKAGQAVFECALHHRGVTLAWGAAYAPPQPPQCPDGGGHPMTRTGGDDPAANLEAVPQPEPAPKA